MLDTSVNPQRRGRGRPPGSGAKKRKRKTFSSASLTSLSRSASEDEDYKSRNSLGLNNRRKNRSDSLTNSSDSDSNDDKMPGSLWSPRGRKSIQRGSASKKRTNGHLASKGALKSFPQSNYITNNNSASRYSGSLNAPAKRPRGRPPSSSTRGGASRKMLISTSRKKVKTSPLPSDSDSELTDRCSTTFPSRRDQATPPIPTQPQNHKISSSASPSSSSESGNSSDASGNHRHPLLRRPPFAPPISTASSSTAAGSSHAVTTATAAALSASAVGMASATSSLTQQQLTKSGFTALEMAGRSSGLGSVPRSHLPPNKRLAAAAAAAGGSDIKMESPGHSSTMSTLHPSGISPRKLTNKQVQVGLLSQIFRLLFKCALYAFLPPVLLFLSSYWMKIDFSGGICGLFLNVL